MPTYFTCPYCDRDDFTSRKGLQQHQQRNKVCNNRILRSYKGPSAIPTIVHDYMQMTQIARQKADNPMPSSMGLSCYALNTNGSNTEETPTTSTKKRPFEETNADFEDFQGVVLGDDESSVDLFAEAAAAAEAMKQEDSDESENALGCDNTMRKSFQEYVLKQVCPLQFTMTEVSAIQLLAKLRQTKAPMNTYDSVMHWHLSTVGKIHELPVIFYIDAATTGQFADLPVMAIKITLSIFSRKA